MEAMTYRFLYLLLAGKAAERRIDAENYLSGGMRVHLAVAWMDWRLADGLVTYAP